MINPGGKNVLIAGGSGMVGSRLKSLLLSRNYSVRVLSREKAKAVNAEIYFWDPAAEIIDPKAVEWADFIVNLAGTGIAEKRWTNARKIAIRNSRVESAALLVNVLNNQENKVKALISASAIGYYGTDKNNIFSEESAPGQDFLATTCLQWEKASCQNQKHGVRQIIIRIGIVLSDKGGALKELVRSFSYGLAVILGHGKQVYSWIHIDDLCEIIIYAMEHNNLSGVFNAVSPNPVTNKEMVHEIAGIKGGKYVFLKVPALMIRFILGDRAAVVLNSQNVSSKKIISAGYSFKFPEIRNALKAILT